MKKIRQSVQAARVSSSKVFEAWRASVRRRRAAITDRRSPPAAEPLSSDRRLHFAFRMRRQSQ